MLCRSLYFCVHIATLVLAIVSMLVPPPRGANKVKVKDTVTVKDD